APARRSGAKSKCARPASSRMRCRRAPPRSRVASGQAPSTARSRRTSSRSRADARRSLRLAGILDGLLDVELDVVELTVLALDLADVDVLDDVAGLRVDQELAARALEDLTLHRREQRIAAALALGRGERVVDDMHAVVAGDGHEVGAELI